MITNFQSPDSLMLCPSNMKMIHQYPSMVCNGFVVWDTRNSDDNDVNGNFNRYAEWGPFYSLVEILEKLNLMDNKIVVEYKNGFCIGFYDGRVKVGTLVHTSGYVKDEHDIMERAKEKGIR